MFSKHETKLNMVADYLILGMIAFVCSLPIITIVPVYLSVLGLYMYETDDRIYSTFFTLLKQNLMKGFIVELIFLLTILIYYWNYSLQSVFNHSEWELIMVLSSCYLLLTFFMLLQASIGFFYLQGKTSKQFLFVCFALSILQLPQMIGLVLIISLLLYLTTLFPYLLIFLPVTIAFFHNKFVRSGWEKYSI